MNSFEQADLAILKEEKRILEMKFDLYDMEYKNKQNAMDVYERLMAKQPNNEAWSEAYNKAKSEAKGLNVDLVSISARLQNINNYIDMLEDRK